MSIPIQTLHLFPVLDGMLIELLQSLSPEDWKKPTVAKMWTVKDVAAHLLDTNIRTISASHQYSGKPPKNINSYRDLANYLNHLNAVWVEAMDRVSPQQLIQMLEETGPQHYNYLASLDPFAPAMYSVAWAGEEQSLNWFHIAREYTEKWHHQQQIRQAVGKAGIVTPELFYPCIDTFMYALPHNYRNVEAEPGDEITIVVSGKEGGTWYLLKTNNGWVLGKESNGNTISTIIITPDIAWQFFTKAITPQYAFNQSDIQGNQELAKPLFGSIAVIA
ncbi:maleylpyruvate isomerase family mycothiol-dependent enzyme [Mucilaginibacter limnophilus]|uniref:Maleylpyruvate isomerase family mycothiol-dependent enzyme n=1 Tax=Mucilaginibacter limnophilus TaxID=1932778 RepID=A0A3S2UL32_9SPHI|nr:maleylpyruvate isomerase N-terminal domain-containing protein [Mucilaginibacter limnophilus]RVU00840.1 maleylpyruvate isomerase family mycothiol-dependent enzyme [Mucilaginibacter limnophilus]